MGLTVQQIQQRLEQIESDTAARQAKGETAAEDFYRLKRDFELEYAKAYVAAKGSPTDKKQQALETLEGSQLYYDLKIAEATYEGWRAAMRTFELRTSIGQSLLKSQRELGG